ncbi:MAG: extracellular solute-binding protein [Chitinispirillales bacterium]|jgi:phosphate transport system substrate-binding protein|nr:extracellular solute-binding protein [Chitinispirillales bacterium]
MKKQTAKLVILAFCTIVSMVFAQGGKQTDVITVVSREEGSGTRSAFTELFGVVDDDKKDITTLNAEITNNTAVMIGSIKNNKRAIGYVSMGSLNSEIKALKINGVEASAKNVINNTYAISRPFIIANKSTISKAAQDFINFIMSVEGQKIVEKNGYISVGAVKTFVTSGASGKVVIGGSSSVSPLMEKLKEAYKALNANVQIEIQQNDSSTGIKMAESGVCDVAMSSRELKSGELEKGLTPTIIAKDGIAVIVNKENLIDNMSKEQVKSIFVGKVTKWSDLKK